MAKSLDYHAGPEGSGSRGLKTNFESVSAVAKNLKFTYAGHIIRSQNDRWNKILIIWVPHNRRRDRGRLTTRWEGELNKVGVGGKKCGMQTRGGGTYQSKCEFPVTPRHHS